MQKKLKSWEQSMYKAATHGIISVLRQFNIVCEQSVELSNFRGGLTNDSREITEGDIFCAIIGHAQDGRKYIDSAIVCGAKLVLAECEQSAEHGEVRYVASDVDVAVISFYKLNEQLFSLASAYYQSPQQNMTMIGITGTNGKTSTSQLLAQALLSCQKPCAIIGTNGAGMVDDLQPLENTTPSATDLVQLFANFSTKKVNEQAISHLAMEVSSHALEQGRISGETFDIAVFTNLSRDHLDYHGTMADYATAKRRLFTNSENQVAVINGDDLQAQHWLRKWPKAQSSERNNLWVYGRGTTVCQYDNFVSCLAIKHHHKGVSFVLSTHLGKSDIHSPLLGDFNIDNLLAAISVLLVEGISLTKIAEVVASVNATPGRMEAFLSAKAPTAVVDYAHTPDALEKALIACRQHCQGKLYVVFGCGGDRDKGKRPLMAQAAQKYADCLVITNDNPRTEAPMSIIEDIIAGLDEGHEATVIVNRKQAVIETLTKAGESDLVLLAGKGHEDYILLGLEKIAYDERKVVQCFFAEKDKQNNEGEQL